MDAALTNDSRPSRGVGPVCSFYIEAKRLSQLYCGDYEDKNPVFLWTELRERKTAKEASAVFKDSPGREA